MLRRLYDWTLTKAEHPYAGWWLAFFAFADGGLFPFPPHPLLALMCLANPKKGVRLAVLTTVASVAGGLLGYTIGHLLYQAVGAQLLVALGLATKFPVAACYLNDNAGKIIVFKAATPIPFLLISITAGFINVSVWKFAALTFLSRGAIFLAIGGLFQKYGPPIKGFIERFLPKLVVAFVVIVVGGYVAISVFTGGARTTHDKCAAATTLPA